MCGKWQDLVANFIEFGHVETCSALAPNPNQFLSNVSIFNLFCLFCHNLHVIFKSNILLTNYFLLIS